MSCSDEKLIDRIRVTGQSDDDEDWLLGESLDGSRSGGFPKVCEIRSCCLVLADRVGLRDAYRGGR